MYNFNYYTPTKVVFGKNTEDKCGELVKEQGCKKVMIHYGSGSVKRTGLLDKVKASLDEAKINYIELGGAVPNPRLSLVYEGIELAKKEGVDFILAVGGGSAIDSAKAIGYGVANEGDVWDFYDKKRQATGCLPIGVVLTIAATGSEMSNSAVLTDEMRLAILKLKYETPDTEKIMGVEYYQAVIQDGVRSYPEFEEWRRLHPAVGVVEWMP